MRILSRQPVSRPRFESGTSQIVYKSEALLLVPCCLAHGAFNERLYCVIKEEGYGGSGRDLL
jgi:hypothetical protein